MRSVMAVIRREYLARVRTRWFLISTIGGPLFAIGLVAGPAYLAQRSQGQIRRLAVVDRTGALSAGVSGRLVEGGYRVESAGTSEEAERELRRRVQEGEIGGYLVLDGQTLSRGRAVFRTRSSPGTVRSLTIRGAVVESALNLRLRQDGAADDVAALLNGGELEVQILGAGSETSPGSGLAAGFIGAFLLYIMIIFYAVAVMRAVIDEKADRIVEIIISAIRPWELMLGKIFGVGAVGLTQLAVWLLMGVGLLAMGLPAMLAAQQGLVSVDELTAALPSFGLVALFLAFFVLGYFLYSALYAAVGAMCSSEQEAQQAQLPVVMLLVVPIVVLSTTLENPDTGLMSGLSLVPFFSPILMFARAASGAAPAWHIGLSLVLMAATIGIVAWVAGRIYRVGILMQGKRPSVPELWRWVREG